MSEIATRHITLDDPEIPVPDLKVVTSIEELDMDLVISKLGDWRWRMDNLYYIVNKDGDMVKFIMNWCQLMLFNNLWSRDLILKARQMGLTTGIQMFILDQCFFNKNTRAGVIAHGLEPAQDIFENKIKYAYDHLPDYVKALNPKVRSNGKHLKFRNESSIRVGTSMRSGTLQILHISEFGKICRRYPERAREIVTGAFPTVNEKGTIFIESTAEGEDGPFYAYTMTAKEDQENARKLARKSYRFFFFPWFQCPDYRTSEEEVAIVDIPARLQDYFYELEMDIGVELDDRQKAWYTLEEKILGDDMFRENPSTPDEAFKQIIRGAYFVREFSNVHKEGRITTVPYSKNVPVDTWWDLGMSDQMVVWFTQTIGGWIHCINYYENSGRGMKHYIDVLRGDERVHQSILDSVDKAAREALKESLEEMKEYSYGNHYGPHDLEVRELMGDGRTRVVKAKEFGISFKVVPRVNDKHDAIDAVRDVLPICLFDEVKCAVGLKRLRNYRREWDQKLGRWKDQPLHDVNSNGADAFMTMATGHPLLSGNVGKSHARKVDTVRTGRML